ncbi:ribonuclease III [Methylophilaceae bacterium]|jgi:ribonuclease-3|nr:ribonuclease III [Methylophilaceae bacterium]
MNTNNIEQLEKILNYIFKDKSLLEQALTHRSFQGNNNERLEFLGDSILNFIIAELLFKKFNLLPEGDLSRLRSQLVKSSTLSEIGILLNLGDYLILGEGELKSSGWRRPSILADSVEAIIGAIYSDGGISAASELIISWYKDKIESINPNDIQKDSKSLLQELIQARKIGLPEYNVVSIEGEAHCQHFKVSCSILKLGISIEGEGSSRKIAEQAAADEVLKKLKNNPKL